MATVADISLKTWTRQSSSPFYDGNTPSSLRAGGMPDTPSTSGDYPPAYMPSATARIIYVDATLGNDATASPTDLASQPSPFNPTGSIQPYQTAAVAEQQLRQNEGDWILFKRGEVWNETGLQLLGRTHGKSQSEPLFVGCYGMTGERPLFKTGVGGFISQTKGIRNHRVYYGLATIANARDFNDPDYVAGNELNNNNTNMVFLDGGENLTIDNCKVSFGSFGITIQGIDPTSFNNVMVKNCIFDRQYGQGGTSHSSGLFLNKIHGNITVNDNTFYRCGWNPDFPSSAYRTQYNHGLYQQGTCEGNYLEFRRNIVLECSANGSQMRSGGTAEDNFFARNSIGPFVSSLVTFVGGTNRPKALNNVVLEGTSQGGGAGATTAIWGIRMGVNETINTEYHNNLVANRIDSDTNSGISTQGTGTFIESGNIVHAWNASEDIDSTGLPNPNAGTADYMVHTGDGTTYEDLVSQVISRNVDEAPANYTAPVINDWFRANFNMSEYV